MRITQRINFGPSIGNLFWAIVKQFPWRMIACDVSLSCIPKSTAFPHPIGIVIRENTKIGENCIIYQNVTIGVKNPQGKTEEPATIGDNVRIFAGAIILGPVHIGSGATIAAGSVVLRDVPERCVYINGRTERMKRG